MNANDAQEEAVQIDGAVAIELGTDWHGWNAAMWLGLPEAPSVQLRGLIGEDEGGRDAGVWIASPQGKGNAARSTRVRAAREGWHRALATPSRHPGNATVVITWEGEELKCPAHNARGEAWRWIEESPRGERARNLAGARELARYFILDWKSECNLGRALDERRRTDDPYPECSRLALDNEWLLAELAHRPWEIDAEDEERCIDIAEQLRAIMGWEAPHEAG